MTKSDSVTAIACDNKLIAPIRAAKRVQLAVENTSAVDNKHDLLTTAAGRAIIDNVHVS